MITMKNKKHNNTEKIKALELLAVTKLAENKNSKQHTNDSTCPLCGTALKQSTNWLTHLLDYHKLSYNGVLIVAIGTALLTEISDTAISKLSDDAHEKRKTKNHQ